MMTRAGYGTCEIVYPQGQSVLMFRGTNDDAALS